MLRAAAARSVQKGLGVQSRGFSYTRPLLVDCRDVPKHMDAWPLPPYMTGKLQEPRAEARFRLVGPPWSEALVHKMHGLRRDKTYYHWRMRSRWRRLKPEWADKYQENLLPLGVNNRRWSTSEDVEQYNIC
eukprot:TRINITY_DN41316_c0_g1_i1.p1 TRINITY_DN41316_c0_g1~~TRINITY_DN41316_c0_g1_i1.p1  ORF type:complete len:131 (+),score=13.61 TRINITY_DN41316_c0_g1_i1:84-476(+)